MSALLATIVYSKRRMEILLQRRGNCRAIIDSSGLRYIAYRS